MYLNIIQKEILKLSLENHYNLGNKCKRVQKGMENYIYQYILYNKYPVSKCRVLRADFQTF